MGPLITVVALLWVIAGVRAVEEPSRCFGQTIPRCAHVPTDGNNYGSKRRWSRIGRLMMDTRMRWTGEDLTGASRAPRGNRRKGGRLAVLLVVGAMVGAVTGGVGATAAADLDTTDLVEVDAATPRSFGDEPDLANSALRRAVGDFERGQLLEFDAGQLPRPDVAAVEDMVLVDIKHDLSSASVAEVIADLGGRIYAELPGVLLEAWIPIDGLVDLEVYPGVRYVQPPPRALPIPVPEPTPEARTTAPVARATTIIGEEVAKTRADVWHAAGFTGDNVKVGIIDIFGRNVWNAAEAAGEVPGPTGTFCRIVGQPCDLFGLLPNEEHGTAVAEIIHEMAPGAQLYLAFAHTTGDYLAAVDFFASQGVTIVNNSSTADYDGPGDGTGPRADVVDYAVSNGMAWFNSGGNDAGDDQNYGKYWRGEWKDANSNGWLDWAPGDEVMGFFCASASGLRWDDWAANPTDYDLFVWDTIDDVGDWSKLKAFSENRQTAGADPVENYGNLSCANSSDVDFMAVQRINQGSGSAGDVLEFKLLSGGLEHWQNPYSGSGPYADTPSPGGLSVGAIDPPLGPTIGTYSSWGPTNDERTKPDLSAAAGVSSLSYGTFHGTSAASPTSAGAAALVLSSGEASTPDQLKDYLLNEAVVDRGTSGTDNTYGAGELRLPDPPDSQALIANDDFASVDSGGTVVINVLANDTNPEGAAAVVKTSEPQHGTVTLDANYDFVYTHDGSNTTTDSFTYILDDSVMQSAPATVTVTITQVLPEVLEAATVGLVDPTAGLWYLRDDDGEVTSFYFGNPGDVPFVGDWDCDGDATPGLFRQSDAYAYLRNSNSQGIADIRFFFGNPSDVPLAGDFNGDGCDTLSIYRPSEQRFYIMNQLGANEGGLGAAEYSFVFGNPGDKPVVGDWDGDGIDEVGLHRESSGYFYYRNTLDAGAASDEFYFGDPGDRFVAGDWGTVDKVDTPACYRPSDTTFFFRWTNTPGGADSQITWGDTAWLPVAGVFGL